MTKPGQCIWIFCTVQAEFLTSNPLRNDEAQAKEEKKNKNTACIST